MKLARIAGGAVGALSLSTGAAVAQCITIDFEDLAPGTVVSTQYDGVTFSAVPGSCGGGNPDPIIVVPTSGTASPSRALGIGTGCPDFSPDYLRMEFDDLQRRVTFTLGDQASTGAVFSVRAYNGSGTLISTQSVTCGAGVFRFVAISAPNPLIKRVEVQSAIDLYETIDDLSFGLDVTPPIARIDAPAWYSCQCDGVQVVGLACDDDGAYSEDRLEYRAVGAAPGTPWTQIGSYDSPVCSAGPLYAWNLAAVPHGTYLLRLTVENACGLVATDMVAVHVDKLFSELSVTSPTNGAAVCGEVSILGTVQDACGGCFDAYTVVYGPGPQGPWLPVDPAHADYRQIVINGTLAAWDTVGLGVADGTWWLRVDGVDVCGNSASQLLSVVVDNAAGCTCPDLDGNGVVDFNDLLLVLSAWDDACP